MDIYEHQETVAKHHNVLQTMQYEIDDLKKEIQKKDEIIESLKKQIKEGKEK